MEANDEGIARAMAEANEVFGGLGDAIEAAVKDAGDGPIDVLEVGRRANLDIDESVIRHLELPRHLYPLHWLTWRDWFPWRPLWCWWWSERYPWYHCCHWWWCCCRPWYR